MRYLLFGYCSKKSARDIVPPQYEHLFICV
jgi:hypothetical protein